MFEAITLETFCYSIDTVLKGGFYENKSPSRRIRHQNGPITPQPLPGSDKIEARIHPNEFYDKNAITYARRCDSLTDTSQLYVSLGNISNLMVRKRLKDI